MNVGFTMLLICILCCVPAILLYTLFYSKQEKVQKEHAKLERESWDWNDEKDAEKPEYIEFKKKLERAEKRYNFFKDWIGFGKGKKLIYSIVSVLSQIVIFCAFCAIFFLSIVWPIDRYNYRHWDEEVDYYNSIEEPTAEDIERAKKHNTCNYGENPFVFVSAEEKEHIKTYRVDTDAMMRKLYMRIGVIESDADKITAGN